MATTKLHIELPPQREIVVRGCCEALLLPLALGEKELKTKAHKGGKPYDMLTTELLIHSKAQE